ncbi:ImmA/IrrE family metallo-endopeptidase [Paraburkholderia sp. 31.1]|uniref:ImmA/IrrE family metallo-endopeptidase n=1 Tax=Paraburkholderia sp. 31.1 TaxID=2615205 RepID=UPI0016556245|nr:ImmA/IrrE family metallo-endopeptidase [Paraburkholderia sp. 31.1]MBC8725815.1 ImmA/IrrE family metallo-endopeptidase [Paraburkholderia sp. 31.1]
MERGYLVQPRSTEFIRSVAHRMLDALDMRGRQVPIMQVLESVLPAVDETFSFEVMDADEMVQYFRMHADGMTVHSTNKIVLRTDVYVGACSGSGRDRFTAAHELGHLLLHRGEGMSFPRKSTGAKVYCDSEWQANSFAREFLADIRVASQFRIPAELAAHFCVSSKVAEIQWATAKKWPHRGTI